MLFWHSYFQYKKWYIVYLIKRCSKWQNLFSQTFTQEKLLQKMWFFIICTCQNMYNKKNVFIENIVAALNIYGPCNLCFLDKGLSDKQLSCHGQLWLLSLWLEGHRQSTNCMLCWKWKCHANWKDYNGIQNKTMDR